MPRLNGDVGEIRPVENKAQLVEYLAAGCTPPDGFRLGIEHEQFVYQGNDFRPAQYDGPDPGIRSLLDGMTRFGWEPVLEGSLPIALRQGDRSITLEPGGQLEFSGSPLDNVHEADREFRVNDGQLRTLADDLGLHFLSLGHQPRWPRSELPWMPKDRYRIMRDHMPTQGSHGLDMMQATCAIQLNVDFSSESDMVRKFRVTQALQPLVKALFLSSPFAEGANSGFQGYRNHIWNNTDPDRCGSLPFVFEEGMGFERYTDYILDVPMYFVIRDGSYIDARGMSFRDFLAGRLPVLPGRKPLLSDWVTHVNTVFPDVRLKRFLELRGADAGCSATRVAALAALWAGLLYDTEAMDAAWERAGKWTPGEREALDADVAKHGFRTPFRDETVQDLCLWMLELSQRGLQARNRTNRQGQDESCFLAPLWKAARSGTTFSEQLLQRFEGEWNQDMEIAVRAMCEEASS